MKELKIKKEILLERTLKVIDDILERIESIGPSGCYKDTDETKCIILQDLTGLGDCQGGKPCPYKGLKIVVER